MNPAMSTPDPSTGYEYKVSYGRIGDTLVYKSTPNSMCDAVNSPENLMGAAPNTEITERVVTKGNRAAGEVKGAYMLAMKTIVDIPAVPTHTIFSLPLFASATNISCLTG